MTISSTNYQDALRALVEEEREVKSFELVINRIFTPKQAERLLKEASTHLQCLRAEVDAYRHKTNV